MSGHPSTIPNTTLWCHVTYLYLFLDNVGLWSCSLTGRIYGTWSYGHRQYIQNRTIILSKVNRCFVFSITMKAKLYCQRMNRSLVEHQYTDNLWTPILKIWKLLIYLLTHFMPKPILCTAVYFSSFFVFFLMISMFQIQATLTHCVLYRLFGLRSWEALKAVMPYFWNYVFRSRAGWCGFSLLTLKMKEQWKKSDTKLDIYKMHVTGVERMCQDQERNGRDM